MQPSVSRWPLLDLVHRGGTTVIRLAGPALVDEEIIEALARQLLEAVGKAGPRVVVFNCADIEEFSSALLGKFVCLRKRLEAQGRQLVLCELPPHLAEVLGRLRLMTFFTVCHDEQDALGVR